ncbi:MAG: hypothetical protein AABP62_19565 [Planctomycetota bacterium]
MRQFSSLALLGLASFAMGLSPEEASAQNVRYGISFGNGGVRVGIGNGPIYGPGYGRYGYGPGLGYGSGFGPGYGYGPPPVVVRPYPVYQPQPVYVQPQYIQQPVVVRESYVPTSPSPLADGGEILLFSPASTPGDVRYTLNGHPYTMAPGTKQKFANDRPWTIEFESSPGRVSQYTLTSSRYKFKPSDAGLGLFQTQDLPESAPRGLPAAPIPNPPEPSAEDSVVPPRPTLKTTP